MTWKTTDTKETEEVGATLARRLQSEHFPHPFVALFGDMGVGKTAFCRGFCRELGILRVKSPTYTIVNEYKGGVCPVYHFDLYRLSGEDELDGIGYTEYLSRPGMILCEWPERAEDALPADCVRVYLSRTENDGERTIEILMPGEAGEGEKKC